MSSVCFADEKDEEDDDEDIARNLFAVFLNISGAYYLFRFLNIFYIIPFFIRFITHIAC